ncbi:MAG: hypothetical protein IJE22_03000 [Oscillibacter sp.]|nr:hypothetical protein [Oscillibacter sp.]
MRKTVTLLLRLAVVYQLLLLVHLALLVFAPGVNTAILISIEGLYVLGWFLWCLHKEVHTLTGKAPYAGAFAVIYATVRFSDDLLRFLNVPLELQMTFALFAAAEMAALAMLGTAWIAKHNLPYEGAEL